jgi:hypothetical protein
MWLMDKVSKDMITLGIMALIRNLDSDIAKAKDSKGIGWEKAVGFLTERRDAARKLVGNLSEEFRHPNEAELRRLGYVLAARVLRDDLELNEEEQAAAGYFAWDEHQRWEKVMNEIAQRVADLSENEGIGPMDAIDNFVSQARFIGDEDEVKRLEEYRERLIEEVNAQ